MKWTDSCDALVDFVEEHGGSMGGETRDHLFNIVQNIVDGQSVLETPPPDWNQPFPDECKHYNLPENCHWCKEESTAPVEPVPADSEMNLRREILDVLAANHTSAYDLRNDLYAIFQGVEPVPSPPNVVERIRDFIGNIEESEQEWDAYYIAGGVLAICESAPVPAPRLEWVRATYYGSDKPVVPEHWLCPDWDIRLKEGERGECAWMNGKYELTTDAIHCDNYECGSSTYIDCFETVDAAKSLAEKLNDVLSPPVGPQPTKGN